MSKDRQTGSRPGLKAGRVNEFTLMFKLKPGGAERLRKKIAGDSNFQSHVDGVGTVHDLRFTIFDNDTRLLFASTFDGDWDAYIEDFGTFIPDYIAKYQVTSTYFYSAYPDASVRDIRKAMKIERGLDVLLDAASS